MSINIRKVDMEQVEDILSYLNSLESLIRDLERRVTDLSEIELALENWEKN